MTLKTGIFLIVLAASFGAIIFNVRRLMDLLRVGKWTNRFDNPIERFKRTMTIAIGQSKIMRDPVAGPIHVFIFWGFLVLVFAVIESIGEGLFGRFSLSFLGGVYSVITVSQDIFIALVIIGVIGALWRRLVTKVKRLQSSDEHEKKDAQLILYTIALIVVALLMTNASRIATGGIYPHEVRPLASFVAGFLCPCNQTLGWYEGFWWVHIIAV